MRSFHSFVNMKEMCDETIRQGSELRAQSSEFRVQRVHGRESVFSAFP